MEASQTAGAREGRRYASVIGSRECDERTARIAQEVGAGLAKAGFTVVTGGLGGVMEAASRGAHEAGGLVVGILPGADRSEANAYAGITIPTGLGHARNLAVAASGDVVIGVSGGFGTLSEIGLAGVLDRPVVLVDGWQLSHEEKLPGEVHYAKDAAEAVELAVGLASRRRRGPAAGA